MGRASSNKKASSAKKVARAARTGGGRTRRGASSLGWPSVMAVVVIVGIALTVTSRNGRSDAEATPPRRGDHWHAAIGFDICGEFQAPLGDTGMAGTGIHTHGDGLVHIEPLTSRATGSNAVLALFFKSTRVKAAGGLIQLPGAKLYKDGGRCGAKPAKLQVKVWEPATPEGRLAVGDPGDIRLRDQQLITIAFVPEGSDISKPPSEQELAKQGIAPPDDSGLPADGATPPADGATPPPAPPADGTPPPAPPPAP